MTVRPAGRRLAVAVALLALGGACTQAPGDRAPQAALRYSVSEGESENHFIRQDGIAAHLNLRTQPAPRLVVAFPAGNSGAAVHFEAAGGTAVWGAVEDLRTVRLEDDSGRALYGISAEVGVAAGRLSVREADVGSVRFLRGAVDYSALPGRAPPRIEVDGKRLSVTRERPDGRSSYLLSVEVLAGRLQSEEGIVFAGDGELRLRVTAASGDPLEMPVSVDRLLRPAAADNEALESALAFLTYEGKMLAGSWRFLTYFGRDTLLSVQLLMPALTAEAAEIGLGSVLERVDGRGRVVHEEELGELAVYRNLAERGEASAAPVYDYAMADDDLMLAPVLGRYLEVFGRERAMRFLAGTTRSNDSRRSVLARNLRLVAERAAAFAGEPVAGNLVAIREDLNFGNWRDSEEGLAGGRYPYDVNAVLMPAALRAAAGIAGSGLLGDEARALPGEDELRRRAAVWEARAHGYFEVSVAADEAGAAVAAYARDHGYPAVTAPGKDVGFFAVALDERSEPIPVMHSDVGMDLLFLQRPPRHLAQLVDSLAAPFPAGLATPVGILAANPAYAGPAEQALVTRNHYHGTVVWSWQQAMAIAGLDRQLRRTDLPDALRSRLQEARRAARQRIAAAREIVNSELWSFAIREGGYAIAPFGQSEGHLTESNAAQLWSTVFLALEPEAP
ncbi:MAG: hypothetical protein MJA32_13005 [Proteobacteria bacterium]|nr:hypothetical protein [Pseudomonadota bacterium]